MVSRTPLSAEDYRQLREWALSAWELPDADREAFVGDVTADRPELRDPLASLISGGEIDPTADGAGLAIDAAGALSGSGASDAEFPDIDGYRIQQAIGEGGMGSVYLAEQTHPVERRVALKVIRIGMDTREVLARFEAEHHALALMNHSGIAKVYDAGSSRAGRPYFAMEYVAGVPIHEFCERERLTTTERIELFIEVCQAVQHAHQKGVVHRDLKPSNVLVTIEDGKPRPKIIDFGVAKAIAQPLTERTLFTEVGQFIGTPEYMSPEQADGSGLDVDTRTDVYSLGVILYELLVGALPFDPETLRRSGFAEIQRVIREVDPPKPSTRLSTLDGDATPPTTRGGRRELARSLRGDLDWIIMKALEKSRRRRYESASEFAADLRRHLDDVPVSAGPPSLFYQLAKLSRRHRAAVTSTVVVFVVLVISLGGVAAQYVRAEQERERADAQTAELLRLSDAYRLRTLSAEVDGLFPAVPERRDAFAEWIERAEPLAGRLSVHRETLERLRERGNAETHVDAAGATSETWRFDDDESRWQHEVLGGLVKELAAFSDADPAVGALTRVRRALAFADSLERRSRIEPAVAEAWRVAIEDIRTHPQYGGLDLGPQLGLVPLRRDPQSKLWEFWHLASGARPECATTDGEWQLNEDTGIVLVLIPGGTFWMGAQSSDPSAPSYDPHAKEHEAPLHEVTLAPFFMSKYEMTQAQWRRFTGGNPSRYGERFSHKGHQNDATNPIERITWEDADRVVRQLDLELPTEAQWEYAARAGSTDPWWCGADAESVSRSTAANLADARSKSRQPMNWTYEEWEDDWIVHAPVGRFAANGFGLHDVLGNVHEWCRDVYGLYTTGVREGDGLRLVAGGTKRITRGGSFMNPAHSARVSYRVSDRPTTRYPSLGVRPSRSVER